MKTLKRARVMSIVALCSVGIAGSAVAQSPSSKSSMAHTDAAAMLKQDMRKLWTDHVVWTRDYIVAAVGDQSDAQAAAGRLMKNQDDIGSAVAKYYGAACTITSCTCRMRYLTASSSSFRLSLA